MNNNKLTAEEMFERNYVRFKGVYFIPRSDFLICMEQFAGQEAEHLTAEKDARIKELEEKLSYLPSWASYNHAVTESGEANIMIDEIKTKLAEAQRQLDEAVNLLRKWNAEIEAPQGSLFTVRYKTEDFLSRLSSGETEKEVEPGKEV